MDDFHQADGSHLSLPPRELPVKLLAIHLELGRLRLGFAVPREKANPNSKERAKFLCFSTEASHVFFVVRPIKGPSESKPSSITRNGCFHDTASLDRFQDQPMGNVGTS